MTNLAASSATGDSPRILITRLSAIGDCVQTLPVATALRERFPRAYIAWAVEAVAAPLVTAHPAIDQVIVIPKRMLASPAAAWQVRRELAPLGLEIAIDPQGLSKSSAVGWLSGARRRIGFAGPQGREISPWINNELVQPQATHMVERYLELLQPLGIVEPRVRFGIEITAAAREAIGPLVGRDDFAGGYVVINPGAGWDSKRWPLARFAAVARELGRRHALPSVVVWAGERERAWAEQLVGAAAGQATLAPRTSLLELAALLERARLVVAADTGPLHLAAAVGTPCVGIFGSTRREACGPYGAGQVGLQAAYDGSHGRKLPGADNWAIRRVTARNVFAACEEILDRQAAPHRLAASR